MASVELCRRAPREEFIQRCDEALHGEGLLLRIREAILKERPVGGPKVKREELRHLVAVGDRRLGHLHVAPRGVGAYAGLNGAFVIATPPEGDDLAYLDNRSPGAPS
ncbi:Scr1 family TA system antitoxin-like transcriptional regulator [Verrucosispora sp. WMMD573]|nr:Scr1 family TA system antitoxin-like transcriptional regulator [Verrucosispora sp. WMMD573]WBB57398.1 Scr1 family TA system antitoxin-like transcriptional regulator [Verrucosispora sp. WMMD573]